MKKILLYLAVGLASCLVVNYFTSCNVANKSRSIENKSVDSSSVTSVDSSKLLSHDSTSVKKETSVDSSSHKHVENKKLILTFDTSSHSLDIGHINPYEYLIDNRKITSAQPITSAVIDDYNEDDSNETSIHSGSDSLQVKDLDSGKLKKDGNTHLATGDFAGTLSILDVEKKTSIFSVKGHNGIINAIDGIGGSEIGCGSAEIVTGGRDG